jgi:hypothetical protein
VSVPRLASRSDAEARDKASSAGHRPRKAEEDGMVYWLGRMHFYFGQLNDMML